MSVSINLVAEYSKVYPDNEFDIEQLVSGIPQKGILNIASHFLMIQTLDKKDLKWDYIKKYWFSNQASKDYIDLVTRIETAYSSELGLNQVSILTTYSSLKLLQLGLDLSDSSYLKSDEQVELDVFKIYLRYNEEISNLQVENISYLDENYSNIAKPLKLFILSFSTSEFENYIYSREFFCQSVKSMFFFKFLEN